jgi:DNA-binding NarL/FixJ family response regulator
MSVSDVTPDKAITVAIVEDHPLLIQGLRRVIELEDDMVVVGDARDGEAAVELVLQRRPRVVLMDINLPKKNGLQAIREIVNALRPAHVGIIVLTAYDDQEQFYHALRAGAAAYFLKDVSSSELIPAIRTVAANKYLIQGRVMSQVAAYRWLVERIGQMATVSDEADSLFSPLSAREMEVLTWITRGASNKEIAHLLGISHQTVKNHISNVLRKLAVEDRTQAAVLALRRGWLRLEDARLD